VTHASRRAACSSAIQPLASQQRQDVPPISAFGSPTALCSIVLLYYTQTLAELQPAKKIKANPQFAEAVTLKLPFEPRHQLLWF